MQLAYNAANTIEAQLLKDRLAAEGIDARIDGEYLQGGVGELQALGIVRLMVAEEDLPRAREILNDWDNNNRNEPEAAKPPSSTRVIAGMVLGGIVAVALVFLLAGGS